MCSKEEDKVPKKHKDENLLPKFDVSSDDFKLFAMQNIKQIIEKFKKEKENQNG